MSSLYLNVHLQSDNTAAQASIRQFVASVNARDEVALAAMDLDGLLEDATDLFDTTIELREANGIFNLKFDVGRSFDVDDLVPFFHGIGVATVEISMFDSGSGATIYVDNRGAYSEDYAAGSWKLIAPTESDSDRCPDDAGAAGNAAQAVVAYEYRFPSKKTTIVLGAERREALVTLLRANGYMNAYYYQAQLDNLRHHRPDAVEKYRQYRHAIDIPIEERGSLDPRNEWAVAHIFRNHNTLVTTQFPTIFKADKKGYGYALAQIALHSGMLVEDIVYEPVAGAQGTFALSCRFEGKPFRATFKSSKTSIPKPFVRLLYDMAAHSTSWDFIVHSQPGERSYAVIPSALARGLAGLGFLAPLFNVPI